MLRMIILRLCILHMMILIECVIVIIVMEWIDLICLSFSGRPYLVGQLQFFTLFFGRIGILRITAMASIANNLVYHFFII